MASLGLERGERSGAGAGRFPARGASGGPTTGDQGTRVAVYNEWRKGGLGHFRFETGIITNSSASPIYEVVVGVGHFGPSGTAFLSGTEHNVYVPVVPPGTYPVSATGMRGAVETVRDAQGKDVPREVWLDKRGLTITFRDGNGVAWQRDARGYLSEIKHNDPASSRGLVEGIP